MQLYVKTINGETFSITGELSDTVKNLKSKIQKEKDMPLKDISLIYMGKQLEDDKLLSDYNIDNQSTLHIAIRLAGGAEITVYIKNVQGSDTAILIEENATVKDLKTKIYQNDNKIAVSTQFLMYLGVTMSDEKALKFYNIEDQSTIHLVIRLIGGIIYYDNLSIYH